MKKSFLLLLAFTATFSACTHDADPLIGTWTVSKVNVQFDERRNTPELVKHHSVLLNQATCTVTQFLSGTRIYASVLLPAFSDVVTLSTAWRVTCI